MKILTVYFHDRPYLQDSTHVVVSIRFSEKFAKVNRCELTNWRFIVRKYEQIRIVQGIPLQNKNSKEFTDIERLRYKESKD